MQLLSALLTTSGSLERKKIEPFSLGNVQFNWPKLFREFSIKFISTSDTRMAASYYSNTCLLKAR